MEMECQECCLFKQQLQQIKYQLNDNNTHTYTFTRIFTLILTHYKNLTLIMVKAQKSKKKKFNKINNKNQMRIKNKTYSLLLNRHSEGRTDRQIDIYTLIDKFRV